MKPLRSSWPTAKWKDPSDAFGFQLEIGLMEARARRDGLLRELSVWFQEEEDRERLAAMIATGGRSGYFQSLQKKLVESGYYPALAQFDGYHQLCEICARLEREEIAMLTGREAVAS